MCREDAFTPDKATLDWMCDEGMKGNPVVVGRNTGWCSVSAATKSMLAPSVTTQLSGDATAALSPANALTVAAGRRSVRTRHV